ncbi:hypothetical protein [Hymenobacter cellulosilyticus]|uniref:Uncharacterized protein n=1 Tax=Hymenobacter cellulosilyticus TaxID=2932248 RepID=A0A8T9Q8E2_9BACT|nr:hypothetical protein [Hymenobacter cellulosilyticus]UOQ71283.1 hypothetical protein MUN79_21965 [Hymenobacter cellulosilyticus]
MRKTCTIQPVSSFTAALAAVLLTASASHAQQLPAFPGAEGFGQNATGGRAGR